MGEIEGTYRVLQTAGTRLSTQTPVGVSTLEPGKMLSPRVPEKHTRVRVKLLDNTVEIFNIEEVFLLRMTAAWLLVVGVGTVLVLVLAG